MIEEKESALDYLSQEVERKEEKLRKFKKIYKEEVLSDKGEEIPEDLLGETHLIINS